MTITSETMRQPPQSGNGVTTSFDYSFKIFDDDDLLVIVVDSDGVETTQTKTTHYTVTGVESESGGTVDFVTAPAAGETVHIILDPAFVQDASLNASAYERIFDKVVQMNQRIKDIVGRSLTLTETSTVGAGEFDLGGQVIKNGGLAVNSSDLVTLGQASEVTEGFANSAKLSSEKAEQAEQNINTTLLDLDGVAISALSTTTSLEDTDLLPLYDNSAGDNAAITWANVKSEMGLGTLASLNQVPDDSIDTDQLAPNAVTSAKISGNTINNSHWVNAADNVSGVDWDDVVTNGFWMGTSTTNNPLGSDTNWWIGQVIAHNQLWVTQELWDFTNSTHNVYRRYRNNGIWKSWVKIATDLGEIHLQYQQPSGTAGGTRYGSTSVWALYPFNTEVKNTIEGSLFLTNKTTLPTGTYKVDARVHGVNMGNARLRINHVTSAGSALVGDSVYSNASNGSTVCHLSGEFEVTSAGEIQIDYRPSDSTGTSSDLGSPASTGDDEIYGNCVIRKVA